MVKIVVFRIEGLSPLLQSNPRAMTRTGDTMGTKKIPTAEEEAESRTYRLEGGQLFVRSEAFRGSILGRGGAASGRRIGKATANSRVAAGLFMPEPECPLVDPKTGKPLHDYEIDTRRALVQRQGVLRSRPMIREWACDLACEVDEDFITVAQVEELLNIGGKVAGVGDFRPQCKGVFGRFRATLKTGKKK
jgi:hypothetical protein